MQSKDQMQAFVIDLLKNNLPLTYYYHNCGHTLYVEEKALEIASNENCTEEQLELVSAAALWHDTGYISMYEDHEKESCRLAKEYLPEFGFVETEIAAICAMIMATKNSAKPGTQLEKILVDADLEYLASSEVVTLAKNLFMEMKQLKPQLTESEWDKMQITFLEKHQYYTNYCKEKKEPEKQKYLCWLKQKMQ